MQSKSFWFSAVLVVLVFATAGPAAATGNGPVAPLMGADAAGAMPGRYIVVMKDGVDAASVDAAVTEAALATVGATRDSIGPEALKQAGIEVNYRYSSALVGFAGSLPEPAVAALRRNPKVAYIEVDQVIRIDTTQTPATWGLDRIDQPNLPLNNSYTYNYTGAGVTAYIIDTGILTSHTEFGGRASVGADTVGDGRNGIDCHGHGTHVAGTVGGSTYGVAKGVSLVAVRVLDCSGSGAYSGVIAGVDWVKANHHDPAVANMSLGGGISTALDTAVTNSINAGVTYAIAAGNSNADACKYSPARTPAAITVGATTTTDARASYSNYGKCLDIFAPGSSVTSAWNTSNTATITISGTSMATPHVAGAAALYLQKSPLSTPQQVRDALVNKATSGKVTNPGSKSPNKLLYTMFF